eukprot:TRINITY_DN1251_c2_g1_i2.p1 TRINITY_DN1251_c2_g1~~TRINITY_DN1251_c2_g1_i2.p1  ORF type:complete len:344 (+),score=46.25 TRINITY_DN1251_c2_g1_i2:94-1125(+)
MTGGALLFPQPSEDKDTYTEQRKLYPMNVLKFRARLDTANGNDIHREFSGAYFPRYRSFYVNEIKDTQRLGTAGIKLIPILPEDVYLKANKDYYYTSDFATSKKLTFEHKGVSKTFIITDVDGSQLSYTTDSGEVEEKKPKPTEIELVLQKIRDKIKSRGRGKLTIKTIGRHFKIVDDSGDRTLEPEEFKKALTEYNIGISDHEANLLISEFDKNGDGSISFNEFLECVRGPMSECRKVCVAAAFKKIDYNKDGILTIDDLRQFYCVKYHPKVLNGEITEDEALRSFLQKFDSFNDDGLVTFAEFSDYYSGVSASIDDDEHFVFMMERAWNLDSRNDTSAPFR